MFGSKVNEAFLVNSCRICLKLQNDPLESDHTFIDQSIQIEFYEITTQKLPLATHLPFKICQTCRNNLRSAHLFRAALTQVQAQLNSLIDTSLLKKKNNGIIDYLKELYILQNANIVCPNTTVGNQVIVTLDIFTTEDDDEAIDDQTYIETYSDESIVPNIDDSLDQQVQSAPKANELTNFKGTEKNYKKKKGKKIVGPKREKALRVKKMPKALKKKCPRCNMKSASEFHIRLHDPIPVECPICNQTYPDRYKLNSHKRKCIASKLEFSCETCGKHIVGDRNFQNHRNGHLPNEQRRFGCDKCDKRFNLQLHLQNHKLTHNPVRAHLCHLCAKSFQQKSNLQQHMLKQHADVLTEKELPQLRCECCDRMFLNTVALKVHLTRMKNRDIIKKETTADARVAKFICTYCKARFVTKEDLQEHRSAHEIICSICAKPFIAQLLHDLHFKRHETETYVRAYKCDEIDCTARFRKPYLLQMHKRKHSGERPYSCNVCDSTFRCSSDVRKHKMTVHKDCSIQVMHKTQLGTFSCKHCDESSYQLFSQLKAHIQKVHPTTINYKCNRCEKSFGTTYKLRHHYRRCPIEQQEDNEARVDDEVADDAVGSLHTKIEINDEYEFEVEYLEETFCDS